MLNTMLGFMVQYLKKSFKITLKCKLTSLANSSKLLFNLGLANLSV